ncbi:hypothetical protein HBO23_32045 [Pseudomonas sp. WS 5532]|uniref:hypothetical protein n=1 Tax=Pseudomonas sp. WS 5532 TaxID=2717495 RepID=UPI001472AB68|nr:hypothetical protein [Pseudomonas sp. WS 5532]NMX77601.1 hypothetical protein [Pseudomonas sp. WS 5532]
MSKFVTYVIRMPESNELKSAINGSIRAAVEANGGDITGQSAEDEMTLAELFESRLDEWEVDEARKELVAIAEAN